MSYFGILKDKLAFSTTALLGNGNTYDSGILDMQDYHQVQTHILSDKNGTIVVYFLQDALGTDILRTLTIPYTGGSGYKLFSAPAFTPYVKYTFTCTETGQSDFYFDTKFLVSALSGQILGLTDFISPAMTANLGRNIIVGETDGGQFKNVPVTAEGHLEMAIHAPVLPFGSVHTEKLTPIFQTDAVYGLTEGQLVYGSTLSGNTFTSESMFQCQTGETIYSQAYLQSRRRLRYRPGQGVLARFTALFSGSAEQSYQTIGVGHAEDGLYMAYSGSSFGILYSSHGAREQQILNISTPSSNSENIDVVLNGVTSSVLVSNSANAFRTAYEISLGTYSGWTAEPTGSAVLFTANSVGNKTGGFSISGSSVVGSFTEIQSGANTTEVFISQSQFNVDTLDGTGPSGITLDPTKGNIYEIGIQYLGFGATSFKVEVASGDNNPDMVAFHNINHPNSRIKPIFGNPAFPFTMAVASAGSTTDLKLRAGSFAGFVEGDRVYTGNRVSYNRTLTSVSTTDYTSIFTIRNSYRFGNRTNQSVINVLSIGWAIRLSQNAYGQFYIFKNASLNGNPNFSRYSDISCTLYDTGSSTVNFTDNKQLLLTIPLSETTDNFVPGIEDLELQPGESLTVAAKLGTGTATFASFTLNTREDQ